MKTMTSEKKAIELKEMDLAQVSGGITMVRSNRKNLCLVSYSNDSRFLNVLLRGREGQCDRYGSWTAGSHTGEIENAWASVGITISHSCYFLDGKKITREMARQHAQDIVGKTLQKSDWDW